MSLHCKDRRVQKANPWGFTLMEMLIVIAIMLLLVIATLPRIKYALDESKVRESTRQLNSYFAMAKARAASTGRPCGLWFVREVVNPGTVPVLTQATQLYLAEVPPPYSGDVLEARVIVHGNVIPSAPTFLNTPWLLEFANASAASLIYLVPDGEVFRIRFDHKGPMYVGIRNGNQFQINGATTLPPHANGDLTNNTYAGYSYEIIRNPRRIGAPLALPRGTCVDLTYSGVGNDGLNFYWEYDPQPFVPANATMPAVLLMFSPTGGVDSVSYLTWDRTNSTYRFVSNDAQGTTHFLVGRPEKVLNTRFGTDSNIADNNALWVSVGRLTGSVVSTDNAPNADFVFTTPPPNPGVQDQEQQAYLTIAREFAITQDVRGGQ